MYQQPIIPMFTQNVREAFRTVGWLRGVWLRIYAAIRVPLAPVYGGFPVKLITHLGKPIEYDPNLTPEQLQKKVCLKFFEFFNVVFQGFVTACYYDISLFECLNTFYY